MSGSTLFAQGKTPRKSPRASVGQTVGVCDISVIYSRPSVRGREMLGGKIPFGKVWRTGADEATVISFSYDVLFGGQKVPAGKYAFFAIPDAEKWTLILNKTWDQWGAYNYEEKEDICRTEIAPEKITHTEMCSYSFDNVSDTAAVLILEWEKTRISIPIKTETHRQTLAEIEKAEKIAQGFWYNYSAAAQYHFYEKKEAEKALTYINTAIALHAPNPAPWMLKSQILAFQGKYRKAITEAEKAIEVSKKHNFWYELEENEAQIKKWKKMID